MTRTFLFFTGLALFTACGERTPSASNMPAEAEQTSQQAEGQLPPDFEAFYRRFHTDSLFQIEHIVWPLQGLTAVETDGGNLQKQAVYWELKTWRMHRPVNFGSGEFKRRVEVLGDELVVEHISYAAANFGLERRFVRRSDGDWELIYYADILEGGQ